MDPLAALFSTIDSMKRRGTDFAKNPLEGMRQLLANANTAAGEHLDQLRAATAEKDWTGPENRKYQALINAVVANNPASIGMFVGKKAAANMHPQVLENLDTAKFMDQFPHNGPEKIWQETGWGKDPFGYWKTEIPDTGMMLKLEEGAGRDQWQTPGPDTPLRESVHHPEVLQAYPSLNDYGTAIAVDPRIRPEMAGGAHVPPGQSRMFPQGQIDATSPDILHAESTTLHEIQHAIQKVEGWPGGSNPQTFLNRSANIPEMPSQSEIEAAWRAYQNTAGEAEARMTQARQPLTAEQRRQLYPWDETIWQQGTGTLPQDLIDHTNGMPNFLSR